MRFTSMLLFLFGMISVSSAQVFTPVKWDTGYKQISANEFDLIFTAKIDDGWSIYSQYLESDDGPVRTSFEWDNGDHYSLAGKNAESGNRKEGYDKVFDMNVIKFKKKAIFTQRVTVNDLSKPISGYLTYMTCDDSRCLPPTDVDFNFALKATLPADQGAAQPKTDKAEGEVASAPELSKEQNTIIADNNKAAVNSSEAGTPELNAGGNGGGPLTPVIWSGSVKKRADGNYEVNYSGEIIDGWYVYSQHQESDDGPLPTEFLYDPADHYELVGDTKESDNLKTVYDKVFDMEVAKFSKMVTFSQAIKVNDPSQGISGYFSYQTCDDTKCIKEDVDYYLDAAAGKVYFNEAAIAMVDAAKSGSGENISGDTINQEIGNILVTYKDPVGDCGGEDQSSNNLLWTFIFGFAGGLIALLTPCVFPMIPLTVSFFTKGSKTRAEGIRNGLTYGLSIIVIYVALGLLITALFGEEALNLLSTHWLPNLLFFTLFIVFAISFFGYFEITLPSSLANQSDTMADKGGLLGIFFMAATLAIVSFSCTGPIIGTAIVESAKSQLGPFTVMLGFSTALALPFGLFAAFPAWLNSLPSSGGWMTSVKVVLGFLEVALALKFFSVADYLYHWGILKYELFVGLWVVIGFLTTLYLLGFIRFPHDSPLKKIGAVRGTFAAVFAALTIYIATGFTYNDVTKSYNSPSLLSGLAPPSVYNFFLPEPEVDPAIKAEYPSFTKCANNLDCFKDYYEGLSYARENNMPILLDFTGYGCVNCRKTEDHIWVVDPVRNNIDQNFVLISLYVDSRDPLPETLISKQRKNKIRTVGNKWADFQIVNFAQNSQPLYVLMSPEEQVLARPVGYMQGWSDWEDYNELLNCGLQTYQKMKTTTGMKE